MKEGWEIRKLGEICTFQRGLTYSKNDEVEYSDNAVLRSNNVDLETNKLDLSEIKYISEKIIIPEDKKIKNGSLLICMANGSKSHLGKVALIDIEDEFAFGGFMGLVVPDNNMVSSRYLYYSMITPMYKRFIKGLSDGANINNLKFSDLQKFNIPIPPLSEQQRIVSKLDSAFEKIDALKANAENNLKNAKDLFQHVLKKEFEGDNTVLGEVLNLRRGHDLTHEEMKGGKIPVAGSGGIIGYHNVATPIFPCLTIGRSGSVGKVYMYDSCWAHNTVLYVDDFKGNNPYYLKYLMLSLDLHKLGGGCGVPTLNRNNLHPTCIGFNHNLHEQQRIVSILDSLSDKCKQLEENYSKTVAECDALKQSILMEVMSVE